ncbi:AP-1 complex subunit gamma-1, putative [Entamoeba invadens IP1]|uniref:AP-1 complex subunit gamma n=1 Tax=Entamoeba invadens IP1 TaxID=370355 RepID=A0A0A1UAF2_ENTIV|nr:AP-1 complex subunit gamma-1, putative [Entamoeba invadens IP1]ELP92018.1 AP-1 complex subunit gamma-1, putative [Entamoeba invadens IP1]|eukprot:XP_004258789.1 AP-1 complex subunit gamma-1, putative [Entamoeba invadens IP1]
MAKLRELILSVRGAKTAAEEREIITKECAVIRSSMSTNNLIVRHRNVAKLIYIQLLGYPTQYGQMECLTLLSSHHYADKRIGYLALMLLLDETQEVLTLVTNHIHNDLLSSNQFIVGLSLSAIANIGSVGIAQDVAPEVEKLMASPVNYIKKKAAAAALRIVRKCPSYCEIYIQKTKALLVERQLSLQLVGHTLAIELCKHFPPAIGEFRKLIPNMLNNLKVLVNSSFLPDFDVSGLTHPFLQAKILELLGMLGHGDKANSSLMYSVLTFTLNNTSNSRNVGNAVLLEAVKTILQIEAEQNLMQTCVQILIKMLNGKDENFKYVALDTLQYLLEVGAPAIQKNKGVVVECLKDHDHAIRKRALDLVYSLVNENNVVALVKELLTFLQMSDIQFKQDVVVKICWLADKFGPDTKWKFDSILETIVIAGDIVPEEVTWNFVMLIQQNIELQNYAVRRLFEALKKDVSKNALNRVAIWAIGEYGDLLAVNEDQQPAVNPSVMIDLIESIDGSGFSDLTIKGEILVALTKLSARVPQNYYSKITSFLNSYKNNINLELQQRAIEFSQFFNYNELRMDAMNRMPIPENLHQETHAAQVVPETPYIRDTAFEKDNEENSPPISQEETKSKQEGDLLDILGISNNKQQMQKTVEQPNLLDLLGGPVQQQNNQNVVIPMIPTTTTSQSQNVVPNVIPVEHVKQESHQEVQNVLNLLPQTQNSPVAPIEQPPVITPSNELIVQALDNNGINVKFIVKQDKNTFSINATFSNTNSSELQNFSMKVAVPKWIDLALQPPSGNTIPALSTDQVTQQLI